MEQVRAFTKAQGKKNGDHMAGTSADTHIMRGNSVWACYRVIAMVIHLTSLLF